MSDETCERHGCLVCEACAAESTAREILAGLLPGAVLELDRDLWIVVAPNGDIYGRPTPAAAVTAALRAYVKDVRREAGAGALGTAADAVSAEGAALPLGAADDSGPLTGASAYNVRAWAARWLRARAADERSRTR